MEFGILEIKASFKPNRNEEVKVSARLKLIAKEGAQFRGFGQTYGMWPTVWTTEENGWPTKGEIDIYEGFSFGGSTRFQSNLFYGTQANKNLMGNAAERSVGYGEGWHNVEMYWKNSNGVVTVQTRVDGKVVGNYSNATHKDLRLENFGPHNMILNMAVGSNNNLFDNSKINGFTETQMWVDSVKVEKRTL